MKKIIAFLAGAAAIMAACSHKAVVVPVDEFPHADWSRNAVIYEVNTRQYSDSGNFAGVMQQLPRLKELGADILWFMPIHPISELNRKGELGSYYAVRDYKAVNPEFGTLDDFKATVDSAHALGMKVIIDWVPNHTGCDNAWVTEHPEYYKLNEDSLMYGPFDWTDVYQLDYSKPETRAAMLDAMKFWLTEAGIDGFRCDVAGMVPVDFWNEARPALDEAAGRPIFMLAEATEPELVEKAFDMDYNWPMKDLFSAIAATSGRYTFEKDGEIKTFDEKHAADIDSLLQAQKAEYPADAYLMNMTSNHDLNSWEGTEFERLGAFAPAFAVLTYTLPGMPVIYTGQEAGLDRALEFFVKDNPPVWEPRNGYFEFYKTLNALRHNRSELAAGVRGAEPVMLEVASPDVLAFVREGADGLTYTAVNLGTEELPVFAGDAPAFDEAVDVFTGEAATVKNSLVPGEYQLITAKARK